MKTHKDLDAWKFSVDLVTLIYELTRDFPKDEIFGLTNQIRRASISIPSNIAEGAARNSTKEFIHFLYISLDSQQEIDTQLLIAKNLKYISEEKYAEIVLKIETVGKLLNGLIKYLKSK
ncbi:four helix bundle protein [Chryseobacterium sp. NKUCC03_KSP]|uniref:four helix bundle protein n=1 Tax=Chryseobacterium sp. NKUCC03_KSP TaxID=2842125 RepID=UPI001C5B12A5|nr:four helix bundle protein [Chryseobacterium sp. NKUCC03_KSP]MBW3523414.1 four helix bundle protein [Chryseobacterium sp. NKUCC03_KSP]